MTFYNFITRRDDILAALTCVSKEETRYYLRGVLIDPVKGHTKINIVSTDGHSLFIAENNSHARSDQPYIVSFDKAAIAQIKSAKNATYIGGIVNAANVQIDCLLLDDSDNLRPISSCFAELIEATYPNYRNVVPSGDLQPVEKPSFDIAILKKFETICKLRGQKKACWYPHTSGSSNGDYSHDPAISRVPGETKAAFIAMPMKPGKDMSAPYFD